MARSTPAERSGTSVRSLKERQREERAALILQSAQDLLVEKGYHDMSIDQIAARVGISTGAIYLHFASKEALVETVLLQQTTTFLEMIERVTAEPTSVRARLEHILAWIYSELRERRGQVLQELKRSLGIALSVVGEREAFRIRLLQVMNHLSALFEEGKRTGELQTTVPTPILVTTFVGLLSPDIYQPLLMSGQFSPAELAFSISTIFFQGVLAASIP